MRYSTIDLRSLVSRLKKPSAKWWEIGLHLGLRYGKLAVIQENYPKDAERCLAEVINAWLTSDDETTRERLEHALWQVGEKKLAQELHDEVNSVEKEEINNPTILHSNRKIFLHVFATLFLILFVNETYNETKYGCSSSFVHVTDVLLGRSREVQEIIECIRRRDIQVFNLYGAPGMGKSMIAKHIGHIMMNEGMDVYYLKVEYIQGSEALRQELMRVTNNKREKSLEVWARNLEQPTLLILDNVDGSYWIRDKMRHDFRRNFVNVLQSNSGKIKILITSQVKILVLDKYHFYRLKPLDLDNCIILLQSMAVETNMAKLSAYKICELVGGVPLIIKILSSVLRPPDGHQADYVINRLESTSKLQFIATQGNRVSETRVISALELCFLSITKECIICTLLLTRHTGVFKTSDTIIAIAREALQQVTESDFHIEDCIHELTIASLLEVNLFFGFKTYEFHTLVRSYLQYSKVNNKPLLNLFWESYFKTFRQSGSFFSKYYQFTEEDVEVFSDLIHNPKYSTVVALHLLHNKSFMCQKCPYKKLQAAALKILNCPKSDEGESATAYIIILRRLTRFSCTKASFNTTFNDWFDSNPTFKQDVGPLHKIICEVITDDICNCINDVSYVFPPMQSVENLLWYGRIGPEE